MVDIHNLGVRKSLNYKYENEKGNSVIHDQRYLVSGTNLMNLYIYETDHYQLKYMIKGVGLNIDNLLVY